MKRFIAVLSGLLVLPAFAEVAPVYYDEIVEYADDVVDAEDDTYQDQENNQKNEQRTIINRSTSASRAISSGTSGTATRKNTSSRAVASSPRSVTGNSRAITARTTRTANIANRSGTKPIVTSRGAQNARATTARVGTSDNSVVPGNKVVARPTASTLTDSGNSLYNSNSARVSANRRSTARLSTVQPKTTTITAEDVTETTNNLNALAELTDYCKAQYAACMDNYCNVLDDNQGRCSCSKNLKNYAKTEAALEQATIEFQDTVQKIKYIGLTGNQVEALFTETEAEISMKGTTDSSKLKNSLDAIKKKIVDVSSPTSAGFESNSGISLDLNGLLDADFTSGFDLNSFLGTTTTSSNVSNQRGETLYNTATNRCKSAVLNSCTAQGVDANVITNSYDLEIDKQCVAYERSLNEANREMKNNVSNATNILQQARLLLQQNKNSYDFRSCIAAIDSCMQDEYVCGSDYELCLDPTGKYLANGQIVKGGTPGIPGGQTKNEYPSSETNLSSWTSGGMYNLYSMWNYNNKYNAWSTGTNENLGGYIDDALETWKNKYTNEDLQSDNMALYLLQKIGYIDKNDKVHGMCASVMKQCQDYTFDSKKNLKTYKPDNEVVRQYLNSTLAKIKVQQDTILSDYAESCRADVQSCLSTNGYDESNVSTTASKTAVNACSAEITTCMSVGGYHNSERAGLSLRAMTDWVASMLINCPVNTYLDDNGNNNVSCKPCGEVENADDSTKKVQTESSGGQVTRCSCPAGYTDIVEPEMNGTTPTGRYELKQCKPDSNA